MPVDQIQTAQLPPRPAPRQLVPTPQVEAEYKGRKVYKLVFHLKRMFAGIDCLFAEVGKNGSMWLWRMNTDELVVRTNENPYARDARDATYTPRNAFFLTRDELLQALAASDNARATATRNVPEPESEGA